MTTIDNSAFMKKLNKKIEEFNKVKGQIEKNRDKLRDLFYEIEELLESVERADLSMETGLQYIEEGLDIMSEYV